MPTRTAPRRGAAARVRRHTRLRLRAAILHSQLEATLDGILAAVPGGEWLSHNRRLVEMWNLPDDILAERSLARALDYMARQTAEPERFLSELQELGMNPERESQTDVQLADGRVFARHSAPVRGPGGEIIGRACYYRDITARRRAEQQLESARAGADAAARARSSFLATMSHEIRSPMNAVIGMADLLLDEPLSEHQRELVQVIRTSGDHLLSVISDILDFTKIDSGKLDLYVTPFHLAQCIEEARGLVDLAARQKQLALHCRLSGGLPETVIGDATRLRQVLVNLLANAVKFTAQGSVTLTAAARKLEGGLQELLFSVADTGIGIPPDLLERLFQPFSQADASTTRKYGGTGLGLAICKRLVELMGGRIWVKSAPGEGSTFHFSITARETAGLAPTERQRRSLDPTLAARLPLHILLAEDVTVNQKVATMMLAKMGYRADIACNGEEAVEAVQRQSYDVILMDVHMPVMDGIEATRRIRATGGARRPWIVALTAGALQHNRDACLAAGMNDFLPKPIEGWKLQAALERCALPAATPADTPGRPPATLDWTALTDVCGVEPDHESPALTELVDEYILDTATRLNAARDCLARGDLPNLARAAHSIKGASAFMGAAAAAHAAAQLEQAARDGPAAACGPLLEELECQYRAARRLLRAGPPKPVPAVNASNYSR